MNHRAKRNRARLCEAPDTTWTFRSRQIYLGKSDLGGTRMTKPIILMKVLLATSIVVAGIAIDASIATASVSKIAVSACSGKSLTERTGPTGAAAGTAYTYLIFINHGTKACALSGVPKAQPVVGSNHYRVGPYASINSIAGRGKLVILTARTGTANVLYAISTAQNYPKANCLPRYATGVVVTFHASSSLRLATYFPIRKQLVCTKLQSTRISGVGKGTSGNP